MKLSEYYWDVIKKGSWGPSYYGVFSKVVNDNNYKNIAEVGIGYGHHVFTVLGDCPNIEKMYLIDPMRWYPNDSFARDIASKETLHPNGHWDEMCDLINHHLNDYKSKYTWLRKTSTEITESQIPDSSLDAVFIDGDHSYEGCYSDLTFWWKKVRSGGQILGDDFWMESVKNALDNFCREENVSYDLLSLPNNSYKIYRIHK